MILLIDNYDSFVHNLARYIELLGPRTLVVRNDQISPAQIDRLAPQAILFSPGPCTPKEAGRSLEIVRHYWKQLPMLGVCLGHQTIAAAFGAEVVRASAPVHGQASPIHHDGRGIFHGVANPLSVGRYHSLVVSPHSLPESLEVTARLEDGTIMALHHRERPIVGLQFHPESILTNGGLVLLANFFREVGIRVAEDPQAIGDRERYQPPIRPLPHWDTPISF